MVGLSIKKNVEHGGRKGFKSRVQPRNKNHEKHTQGAITLNKAYQTEYKL